MTATAPTSDIFLESCQIQHYVDTSALETGKGFDKAKYPNAKPYIVVVRSPYLPGTWGTKTIIANQLYEQKSALDFYLKSIALASLEASTTKPTEK